MNGTKKKSYQLIQSWNANTTYYSGDEVIHNQHKWRARWWSFNEEPGAVTIWGIWEDLGAYGLIPIQERSRLTSVI